MNSVHLVTLEKYRVEPDQKLSQIAQNTPPGPAEHTQARTGTHSGRIVALGPAVSTAPAAVSQPHAARPRVPSRACSSAALRARLTRLLPRPDRLLLLAHPAARSAYRAPACTLAPAASLRPLAQHERAPSALRARLQPARAPARPAPTPAPQPLAHVVSLLQ